MYIANVTTRLYFNNGIDLAPATSFTPAIAADSLALRYPVGYYACLGRLHS
jgi:hypothetical protein